MNNQHESRRINSFKEFTVDLSLWVLQSNNLLKDPTDTRIAIQTFL